MRARVKAQCNAPIKVYLSKVDSAASTRSSFRNFAPPPNSPEVEVLERLQTRDGVRNGADGVVVEYEPLHRIEVGALLRQLGQLVARHI